MVRTSLFALAVGLLAASPCRGQQFRVTFDERPETPLTTPLTVGGVTFGFSSPDAFFNSSAFSFPTSPSPSAAFLQGSVLEGDSAGTLTLDFASPTSALAFGVGLSTADALAAGATVRLFETTGSTSPLQTIVVPTSVRIPPSVSVPAGGPSEGLFSFVSTGAAFRRAQITFNVDAGRFFVDNLTNAVPEPTSIVLLGTGLCALGVNGWRRRRAA